MEITQRAVLCKDYVTDQRFAEGVTRGEDHIWYAVGLPSVGNARGRFLSPACESLHERAAPRARPACNGATVDDDAGGND